MEKRYVAIYTTTLFLPSGSLEQLAERGVLVNKEVSSIEEAYEVFKEAGDLRCWNKQIYDKKNEVYV